MQYRISDIIKSGGYADNDVQNILFCLRKSGKYNDKIKTTAFKGAMVEGDLDEILSDIKPLMEETKKKIADTEAQKAKKEAAEKARVEESKASNDELLSAIESLKANLSDGTKFYEYKTIAFNENYALDAERIELILCKYALEGWRLKVALTSETTAFAATIGTKAVLILERLVVK